MASTKSVREQPYTIFVIEPSSKDFAQIRNTLEPRGFRVRGFQNGESAVRTALASAPSMFILETDLPNTDGLELCQRIRRTSALSLLPVIFVSARAHEADRVAGLDSGADDYVVKPFGKRELIARVRANLRRCYELTQSKPIRFGQLEIDPDAVTVKVKGVPVKASLAEFRLLEYLIRNPGRTFSRSHLIKMIQSSPRVISPRTVDVYVKRIREKIEEDDRHPEYLRTVRRLGYCFHSPSSLPPRNREVRWEEGLELSRTFTKGKN